MSEVDAELVRRTLTGDRSAFEALVAAHLVRARAVARTVLRDEAAIDDVLQESFIRAYERLGQLGEAAAFPAWLCTIVRNESITWLRRSGRLKAVHIDDVEPPAAAEVEVPDPMVERLKTALAQLPVGYREILALKYEADLNYEQIAETLGITVPNVEKRLYRARQALVKLMPELGALL